MKKSGKKQIISIIIFIIGFGFITFNDLGILKLISLYKENKLIQIQINELILEENNLTTEINLLQNDKEYIMKIAREKFFMATPGEKIYRVKREKIIE